MRIIHYSMTFNAPYEINNCLDIHGDGRIETAEGIKNPGVRMVVNVGNSPDELYSYFEHIRVDDTNLEFEKRLPQILSGKDALWKLGRINILPGEVWLTFFNETLYEKYCVAVAKGRHPTAFYGESVVLCDTKIDVELRFEIISSIGTTLATTIVSLGKCSRTVITEFDGDKKRIFTLSPSIPFGEYKVTVEEWMQ